MWFHVRSIKVFKPPPISLNGSPFSQVSTHKYLGVQTDEHLRCFILVQENGLLFVFN